MMQLPEVPKSSELSFSSEHSVRWSDEDMQGVMNNSVFLTLLEEGRFEYFKRLDLMSEGHFPFVLAQCNIRFMSPGSAGRPVTVEMGTVHLGKTSFRQAYRIRSEGSVWCEAEALLVCWNPDTRRPEPMSPVFRAKIEAFEALKGD